MADEAARGVVKEGSPYPGLVVNLALGLAGLVMLVASARTALTRENYESPLRDLGMVCDTSGMCWDVDDDWIERRREDELNRSNRINGGIGVVLGSAAIVIGWRRGRRAWSERDETTQPVPTLVAALCVTPIAAFVIYAATGTLEAFVGWAWP